MFSLLLGVLAFQQAPACLTSDYEAAKIPEVAFKVEAVGMSATVSLDVPDFLILGDTSAKKIAFEHKGFFRPNARVADKKIKSDTMKIPVSFDGRPSQTIRGVHFNAAFKVDYENVIGIPALPENGILLFSRGKRSDCVENLTTYEVPLETNNGRWLMTRKIDGVKLEVRFDFLREKSIANSSAGRLFEYHELGQYTNLAQMSEIAFEVFRPTQSMLLNDFFIGGIPVTSVDVRMPQEKASNFSFEAAATDDVDEYGYEEITVTAKRGHKARLKLKTKPYIILGKDWLENCISSRFDKAEKLLTIQCRN